MACRDGAVQVSNPACGPRLSVTADEASALGVAEIVGEANGAGPFGIADAEDTADTDGFPDTVGPTDTGGFAAAAALPGEAGRVEPDGLGIVASPAEPCGFAV
jgi:hypothetical protein